MGEERREELVASEGGGGGEDNINTKRSFLIYLFIFIVRKKCL